MRRQLILMLLVTTLHSHAANEPTTTPDDLRTTIAAWVDTMRKIQQEKNDWKRDEEVLKNYKEGLEKEISELQEKITDANNRKAGAERDTLEQSKLRDQYATAKDALASSVRALEENMRNLLPILPTPLLADPKVSQAVKELRRSLELPESKRNEGVAKRLQNLITLATEAEKFQQTVHLKQELHRNAEGREFNLQVLYFGLAFAYATDEAGNLALAGKPGPDGWKFQECPELAADIRRLIASTTGDLDATFVPLPLPKP